MTDFEPLAHKVAEANRKRSRVRGTAHSNGVVVEVDADGRTVGLDLSGAAPYLSRQQLAELILELCREAEHNAQPAVREAMRELESDPMVARVATFTDDAMRRRQRRAQRPKTDEELEAEQTRRITRQLHNR